MEFTDLKHLFFVCFVNIIRWNAIVKPVIYKIDVNIANDKDYPSCDLIHFSNDDLSRSIPSLVDGLKPSPYLTLPGLRPLFVLLPLTLTPSPTMTCDCRSIFKNVSKFTEKLCC